MTTKLIPLIALLSTLGLAACQEEGGESENEETEQSEMEGEGDDG